MLKKQKPKHKKTNVCHILHHYLYFIRLMNAQSLFLYDFKKYMTSCFFIPTLIAAPNRWIDFKLSVCLFLRQGLCC